MAEEPLDAPTADSSGGTPPLETDGRTDATGDPEIEMYSDDVGQAGYDDGQEPNDASDPSGGTPPAEGGADSGDEQIETPPEEVGRADAGGDEIEMPPMYVGRGGDDAGDSEIEMPPMYVGRTGLDAAHEEELAQYGTYEELAGLYRSLNENLYERYPDLVEGMNKQLESGEDLDNHEELKAATKGLLDQWYLRDAHHQRLEGRYSDEISVDPGLQTYDQLADYYKNLSMVLRDSDREPDMTGLDTYEKLRVGTYELWEQRDQYLNQHEGEQHLEEKDESHTNDSHNNAPEIEMPPMYVGRDAGSQEPNDAPDPSGGTPRLETVGQVGADAAHEEIEFTPEEAAAIPAQPDPDAGDGEIEMNPEYVGRSDWHKVADKFEEKFPEDELMLQMKFRQMAQDNPDLRVALKNVFGWEDKSRSDWEKVADKFEEKFPEDELVQHMKFRQALEDNPTLRETVKNVFGYGHPDQEDGADRNYKFIYGTEDSNKDSVEHVDKPIYEQPAATETFKTMFGYDPGEEGADHVDDSVVDPVGDL